MLYTVNIDGQVNQNHRNFALRALDKLLATVFSTSTQQDDDDDDKNILTLENFDYDDEKSDYSISSLDEILDQGDTTTMESLRDEEIACSGTTVVVYKGSKSESSCDNFTKQEPQLIDDEDDHVVDE
jgi:hypothetical protein